MQELSGLAMSESIVSSPNSDPLPELVLFSSAPIASCKELFELVNVGSVEARSALSYALRKFETVADLSAHELESVYSLFQNLLIEKFCGVSNQAIAKMCTQIALRLSLPTLCRQKFRGDCNSSFILEYLLMRLAPHRIMEIALAELRLISTQKSVVLKDPKNVGVEIGDFDLLIQPLLTKLVRSEDLCLAPSSGTSNLTETLKLGAFQKMLQRLGLEGRVHLIFGPQVDVQHESAEISTSRNALSVDSLSQILKNLQQSPKDFVLIAASLAARIKLAAEQAGVTIESETIESNKIDHWLILESKGFGRELTLFCPITGTICLTLEETWRVMSVK